MWQKLKNMQILFAKSEEKSYLYANFLSMFPLLMNGEKNIIDTLKVVSTFFWPREWIVSL